MKIVCKKRLQSYYTNQLPLRCCAGQQHGAQVDNSTRLAAAAAAATAAGSGCVAAAAVVSCVDARVGASLVLHLFEHRQVKAQLLSFLAHDGSVGWVDRLAGEQPQACFLGGGGQGVKGGGQGSNMQEGSQGCSQQDSVLVELDTQFQDTPTMSPHTAAGCTHNQART